MGATEMSRQSDEKVDHIYPPLSNKKNMGKPFKRSSAPMAPSLPGLFWTTWRFHFAASKPSTSSAISNADSVVLGALSEQDGENREFRNLQDILYWFTIVIVSLGGYVPNANWYKTRLSFHRRLRAGTCTWPHYFHARFFRSSSAAQLQDHWECCSFPESSPGLRHFKTAEASGPFQCNLTFGSPECIKGAVERAASKKCEAFSQRIGSLPLILAK